MDSKPADGRSVFPTLNLLTKTFHLYKISDCEPNCLDRGNVWLPENREVTLGTREISGGVDLGCPQTDVWTLHYVSILPHTPTHPEVTPAQSKASSISNARDQPESCRLRSQAQDRPVPLSEQTEFRGRLSLRKTLVTPTPHPPALAA